MEPFCSEGFFVSVGAENFMNSVRSFAHTKVRMRSRKRMKKSLSHKLCPKPYSDFVLDCFVFNKSSAAFFAHLFLPVLGECKEELYFQDDQRLSAIGNQYLN